MKKVLILSTSIRHNSNSEILANQCLKGALDAKHDASLISLKKKEIKFCIGCLSCQKAGKCVLKDDVAELLPLVKESDVLIFATPIYYYEMAGQMKTLIDRLNPLYDSDYKFKEVYMIATAAEDEDTAFDKAYTGLLGFVECFERASLKGIVKGKGIADAGEANQFKDKLEEAYNLGYNL